MQQLRFKLILILAIAGLFTFLAFSKDIQLGLDLRGGIHLVMRVDVEEAVGGEIQDGTESFQRLLEDEGVEVATIALDGTASIVSLASDEDSDQAVDIAREYFSSWDVRRSGTDLQISLTTQARADVEDGAVRQALQTIRNRVDEYGVSEPIIQRQGLRGDRILVQLPGVANPERVKTLLRTTAMLELKLVQAGPAASRQSLIDQFNGTLPPGTEILESEPENGVAPSYYLVTAAPAISGRDLKTARLSQDEMQLPAVSFTLNTDGSRKFSRVTGENVGRQLAIVLDDKVQSAPVIEGRISTPSAQITGSFTAREAEDLALVLRAGALPATIHYLEERSVGPSLGQESIDRGRAAAMIGLAIVVVFMLVYYKGAGVNAVVALALNLIIVLGAMNALGATLTLPGIAGLILLIGMAVDANVLIFERVREELAVGKTVRSAVDAGFAKALSAIVDANITTLVAAVFLFQFGTGPVKGFAVTLSIGILASMFTAIFVSRVMFDLWILRRPRTLSI